MTTTMRSVDLYEEVSWHGVVSLERVDGGIQPWRLPHEQRELFDGGELLTRARMPSGARVVLRTDSNRLGLDIVAEMGSAPIDVVVDEKVQRLDAGARSVDLPPGEHTVQIWLPQHGRTTVRSIFIDSGSACSPVAPHGPRWVAHGSSITQCRQADGPTATWPARCARSLNLDLLNLGFGGQCVLDPTVARLIRDTAADLITLCLGINVFGQATHNRRSLLPAVLGFLLTVRDGHPGTPIQVISPIATKIPPAEHNAADLTLSEIGEAVERAVAVLISRGDRHLELIRGPELLGPDETNLLVDSLHPGEDGYRLIADRVQPYLRRALAAVRNTPNGTT